MGKIISIVASRGKVGKTTTAINLSTAFSLTGKKTLLIDLDPSGSCSSGLGFSKEEVANDIFKDLKSSISLHKFFVKTKIEKLDFLRIERLPYIEKHKLGESVTNELILRKLLRPEAEAYDFVILDCPPHQTGTINAALIASDSIIIPVSPGQYSIFSVRSIIKLMDALMKYYNLDFDLVGILLTNYEVSDSISLSSKNEIAINFPNHLLETVVPKSSAIKQTSIIKKQLILNYPNDKASKAYFKLAEELLKKYSKVSQLHK